MSRPLTRSQALENRAFLKVLRRTGNVRLACRELALAYGTMQHRRKAHPEFAARWDAALVFAQARLAKVGLVGPSAARPVGSPLRGRRYKGKGGAAGRRAPSTIHSSVNGPPPSAGIPPTFSRRSLEAGSAPASSGRNGSFRTLGGEMTICRRNDGKLQMRRAQAGKLTREAEQAFLAAVSATCNIRLSAAAVGAAEAAFFRRARKDPAFARELRLALKEGYEALERGLLEAGLPGSHEHDDWRSNAPPAMPPMTVNQALQLMHLHHKEGRPDALLPRPARRRAREPEAAYYERLAQMGRERERRQQEEFEVAEAARWALGEAAWGAAGEAVRRELGLPDAERGPRLRGDDDPGVGLPDLAQVTGWSKADPAKAPHDATRALFGGWRIGEMKAKCRAQRRRREAPPE